MCVDPAVTCDGFRASRYRTASEAVSISILDKMKLMLRPGICGVSEVSLVSELLQSASLTACAVWFRVSDGIYVRLR